MKKVLVISPTPSHPENAGNRARVCSFLTSIKDMGHELYFLHIGAESGGNHELMKARWGKDRYFFVPYIMPQPAAVWKRRPRRLWKIARWYLQKAIHAMRSTKLTIDSWYDPALDKVLSSLAKDIQFDVVMVEYVFYSRAFCHFKPNVVKIIDTIDVFSDRHERMAKQGMTPNWYTASPQEEGRGLNRADVTIAITEEDRQVFSALTKKKVVTIGHFVPQYEPLVAPVPTGKILFVAGANQMNVDAMHYFGRDILPQVRVRYPSIQVMVVGSVCEMLEDHADWTKIGRVDELRPFYVDADVVINPVLFGTGLSIKSLEALGNARPLVTTSCGSRGLTEGVNEAYVVADTPEEFSSAVVSLLSDQKRAEMLCRKAHEFVTRWNASQRRVFEDVINT